MSVDMRWSLHHGLDHSQSAVWSNLIQLRISISFAVSCLLGISSSKNLSFWKTLNWEPAFYIPQLKIDSCYMNQESWKLWPSFDLICQFLIWAQNFLFHVLTTRSENFYLIWQFLWSRFVLSLISSFIICVFHKKKKAYMTAATCYVCLERPVVTDWTRRGDWTCNPSMTSVKLYTFLFHFFVSVIVLKSWQKKATYNFKQCHVDPTLVWHQNPCTTLSPSNNERAHNFCAPTEYLTGWRDETDFWNVTDKNPDTGRFPCYCFCSCLLTLINK